MDMLIKNGTIVNFDKSYKGNIHISDGKISAIDKLSPAKADITIDATGQYVFPGGIDPHVHFHLPGPAGFSADDFNTGSKAALYGGTTSFIDFVTPQKGQNLFEALEERKKEAENSFTYHTFHLSPVEWRDSIPGEIKQCVDRGIKSFKIYMAYLDTIGLKTEDIRKVMHAVAQAGGMVTVHCELGEEVDRLRKMYIQNNQTSPEFHPKSRPDWVEADAVKLAIEMAHEAGCPIYIVHVSTKKSIDHIRKAQQKGQRVFAETCPQYLLLDESKYYGDFDATAPFIISPPLRKKTDIEALWEAIADGTIQTISTDHCPFTMAKKKTGLNDFTKIPNGAAGVEHRLALVYSYGVLQGKITLNQFVNLVSTQPAKIFGLYPQKGAIQAGADADLVIWNPDTENIISAKTHHQHCDINIYEGIKTKGAPEFIISKGKILIKSGIFLKSD